MTVLLGVSGQVKVYTVCTRSIASAVLLFLYKNIMKHEVKHMIDPAIATALITAGVTLVGTTLTVAGGNKKISNELDKHNAIQDERIAELTRRVELHNQVVERTYSLEAQSGRTQVELENITRRLDSVERTR